MLNPAPKTDTRERFQQAATEAFAEPIISRLHPDRPQLLQRLGQISGHVWRFSLGGIDHQRETRWTP